MPYERGDIVSLSRAQETLFEVLLGPTVPGQVYSLTLPINGVPAAFEYVSQITDTTQDVAGGLAAILERDQTVYGVALDGGAPRIGIVGPLGVAFEATAGASSSATLVTSAVAGYQDGREPGPLIVQLAESAIGIGPRRFWTREPNGSLREVNMLRVREQHTGNVFDLDSARVLTVLSRANGSLGEV